MPRNSTPGTAASPRASAAKDSGVAHMLSRDPRMNRAAQALQPPSPPGTPVVTTPGVARRGDYSAAVYGDGAIWMGNEYIPNAPRTLLANWGTFLSRLPA